MSPLDGWLGSFLLLAVTFFSTAIAALQRMSRVQLAEEFDEKPEIERINRLATVREELVFSFSFVRLGLILVLVLLIDHMVGFESTAAGLIGSRSSIAFHYAIVFSISLLLITLTGVLIPSAWARYGGNSFLARSLPLIFLMRLLLYPLVRLQHVYDAFVRRLAGIPNNDQQEQAEQIEREILDVVNEGELAGTVHEDEADMIQSVLEFRDTSVNEIMTPRTEIVALSADATPEAAKELITQSGHSRIPIYIETIDNIQGVLYAKDLLRWDEKVPFDSLKLMRKVPFVPEAKRVSDLLTELRHQQVHLAIVLDEYGGTAGLITIEDILEEIVGEIADEYEGAEPDPMRRIDEHTLEVDARVHIDEVNDELSIEIPEGEDYDTVGGFVLSTMGKIPAVGEEMRFGNVRLQVLDAEERKINRLRIVSLSPSA
ncbi:MAG: hemolysin family protein [Phycisphaerae bacterium]|nr:hemolysin family protein [Phycisphaerae bacterium]